MGLAHTVRLASPESPAMILPLSAIVLALVPLQLHAVSFKSFLKNGKS